MSRFDFFLDMHWGCSTTMAVLLIGCRLRLVKYCLLPQHKSPMGHDFPGWKQNKKGSWMVEQAIHQNSEEINGLLRKFNDSSDNFLGGRALELWT